MKMVFQIATYVVAIIIIGLLTFGQDVPQQYAYLVRDGIQACLALALFFSDPVAFIAKMTSASKGQIPIPATLVPIPGMPGVHQLVPIVGNVEPPPIKTVAVPVVETKPTLPTGTQIVGVG